MFLGMINLLYSQDQDLCKDILVDGLRDTYSENMDYYSQISFMTDISSMNYREFQNNYKAGFDVIIEGIPIGFDMGADEYEKSRNEFKKLLKETNTTKWTKNINVLAANSEIINAWKDCMSDKQKGKFEVIITPISIESGIYSLTYYLSHMEGLTMKMTGVTYDEENLSLKEDWFNQEIIHGTKKKTILKLKDPKKSAFLLISTSRDDYDFFIPGYQEIKRPYLTTESRNKLISQFTFENYPPQNRTWRPTQNPHCHVESNEALKCKNVTIDKYCTRINLDFECDRKGSRYNCGGDWSTPVNNPYSGTITADLTYENGVLKVSDAKIGPIGGVAMDETDCDNDIINLFNGRFKEIIIDLEFTK